MTISRSIQNKSLFEFESSSLLALGADPSTARACVMESVNGKHRLLSWHEEKRQPGSNLSSQFEKIIKTIGNQLGRTLWDDHNNAPLLQSSNSVRTPPLLYVVTAASPHPVLKVWLMGLDQEHSLAAASSAIVSSPAKIIGNTVLTATTSGSEIGSLLTSSQPDVVVICGGYDGRNLATTELLMRLCHFLKDGLTRIAPAQHPVVIYAGNNTAADEATTILQASAPNLTIDVVRNVQPTPYEIQHTAIASAIDNSYQQRNKRTSAFSQLNAWVTPPARMISLETSFIQLVQSWRIYKQLPDLHGLYRTSDQWLHVWATEQSGAAGDAIQTLYISPEERLAALQDWPELRLVSGIWPQRQWHRPELSWCDPSGMAPIVAAVGQVSPLAMLQVLEEDLLS